MKVNCTHTLAHEKRSAQMGYIVLIGWYLKIWTLFTKKTSKKKTSTIITAAAAAAVVVGRKGKNVCQITHIWKAFNLKHDEHEHNKVKWCNENSTIIVMLFIIALKKKCMCVYMHGMPCSGSVCATHWKVKHRKINELNYLSYCNTRSVHNENGLQEGKK